MSKNSKVRRQLATARAMKGQKGPARTAKKTTKKRTWFAIKDGKINAPVRKTESVEDVE